MAVTHTVSFQQKLFAYSWVTVINLLLVFGLWWVSPYGYKKPVLATANIPTIPFNKETLPNTVISGDPIHLSLPDLQIDLNVLSGAYNEVDQSWTLTGTNAHYANVSMPINTSTGNTLIYGHNNKHVFYNLRKITAGTLLTFITNTGYQFKYTFVSKSDVQPNDTSVFRFSGAPTVTIQTCTGNWNETRGMYVFKLSGVQKL